MNRHFVLALPLFLAAAALAAEKTPPAAAEGKTFADYQLTKRFSKTPKQYLRASINDQMIRFYQATAFSSRRQAPAEDPLKSLDYKIEEQSALLHVPAGYDGGPGWGILLYCGVNARGGVPPDWEPILAKRKLIFAAPHQAGPDIPDVRRFALLLDTLVSVQAEYKIEKKRVFAAGEGDGVPPAAMTFLVLPELVRGLLLQGYGFMLQPDELSWDSTGTNQTGRRDWSDNYASRAECPYLAPGDIKKVAALKGRMGQYLCNTENDQRILRSMIHWTKTTIPCAALQNLNGEPTAGAEDLDQLLGHLSGEAVKIPPPDYARYDIRIPGVTDRKPDRK